MGGRASFAYRDRRVKSYWYQAKDTHIADPAYYVRAKPHLQYIVDRYLLATSNVLDVGCGNEEYTGIVAAKVGRVLAYDISAQLLDAARKRCAAVENVSFFQTDSTTRKNAFSGQVDAVFCMGAFACMPEPEQMSRMVRDFHDYLTPLGLLVLRDSTVPGPERYVRYPSGHLGYYRNEAAMIATLADEGFALVEEIALKADSEPLNDYFVLRKERHL